ncbi:MAG: hypothetical protein HY644_12645 [Acidobacteria bacterium]|nr:hypothetical protein [Acidobacteriota bacterium]
MAKKGGTFSKRQKEKSRQERQKTKAARRAEIRELKKNRPAPEAGYDPDLEGIVPGPQPPLEE